MSFFGPAIMKNLFHDSLRLMRQELKLNAGLLAVLSFVLLGLHILDRVFLAVSQEPLSFDPRLPYVLFCFITFNLVLAVCALRAFRTYLQVDQIDGKAVAFVLKFLGFTFVVITLAAALHAFVMLQINLLLRNGAGNLSGFFWVPKIAASGVIALLVPLVKRFSFLLPATLVARPLGLYAAFGMSRGQGLKMAFVVGMAAVPYWLVFRFLPSNDLLPFRAGVAAVAFEAVSVVVWSALVLFCLAVVAAAFNAAAGKSAAQIQD